MAIEIRTDKTDKNGASARRGFSLAFVLVIALAGMALLGASFMLFENFSHRSFRAMGGVEEINAMDHAIEFARLELVKLIENSFTMPRAVFRNTTGAKVKVPDDLIVAEVDGSTVSWDIDGSNIRELSTTANEKIILKIEVFDVLYTSDDVDGTLTAAQRAALPSAMYITPGKASPIITGASTVGATGVNEIDTYEAQSDSSGINTIVSSSEAGVYMIRATITRPDGHGRITEVVQAIKKD